MIQDTDNRLQLALHFRQSFVNITSKCVCVGGGGAKSRRSERECQAIASWSSCETNVSICI